MPVRSEWSGLLCGIAIGGRSRVLVVVMGGGATLKLIFPREGGVVLGDVACSTSFFEVGVFQSEKCNRDE